MRVIGFRATLRCGSIHLECFMRMVGGDVATIRYCLK